MASGIELLKKIPCLRNLGWIKGKEKQSNSLQDK